MGLDVACGTGLSSVALSNLARHVLGVEAAFEMVAHASRGERTAYVNAAAEALPVADTSVDLVTVASAIHWFDQPAFFAEAARALRDQGWLAIYDYYFLGQLNGQPEFSAWNRDVYLQRFPSRLVADSSILGPKPHRASFLWAHRTFVRRSISRTACSSTTS
jgi:ubiquinone/menaquinone biosynthesis C-methylase UbiE